MIEHPGTTGGFWGLPSGHSTEGAMRHRIPFGLAATVTGVVALLAPLKVGAGGLDLPWWHDGPPTLADVARRIDHIQEKLLNQGTVVIKQPDIWSQARMTMFRKEFEDTMKLQLNQFAPTLAAQIARSDAAQFASQTQIGAVLTPFGPTSTAANAPIFTPQITNQPDLNAALTAAVGQTVSPDANKPGIAVPPLPTIGTLPVQTFQLLNQAATGKTDAAGNPVSPLGLALGLEPNVKLDEESDYIGHLHRMRRVNLGDDTSDSAGYALYLMRVPISIQPGDETKKGWGAIANMTIRPDFGPRFLPATYRNLVINDLVDQLAPVVHELIRSGLAQTVAEELPTPPQSPRPVGAVQKFLSAPTEHKRKFFREGRRGFDVAKVISHSARSSITLNRLGPRTYAIAPSDLSRVFPDNSLLTLALHAQQALDLVDPAAADSPGADGHAADLSLFKGARLTDVRAYLRAELESAYDIMEGRCREQQSVLQDVEYIDHLADQVYCRKFEDPKSAPGASSPERNEFTTLYENLTHRLQGKMHDRPVGVLCWGIAIQAGLLNRQLHEDMKQTKGADSFTCPPEVDEMPFFAPMPIPEVETAFEEYVKARWPMITFSVEPVVDEQNIEDSLTRRRDLQLALAFAFTAGRISFRQLLQYNRQLQYEAQTIALNQTVVGFANGNDTFGWRITPRYQTPPDESNPRAIINLLLRGGPGPNYVLKNSKIEPGLRELTAVVIMPSFVRGMRLDVSGDWFRLHDPDERKIHSTRTVEIGRQINEARDCLDEACKCGKYRSEDVERLRIRLHQLETMLPLQTQFVKVPYANTLGGFALFTQGLTALAPELLGFEGLQYIAPEKGGDIVVYGKNFSLYETEVVVGGVTLPREGTGTAFVPAQDGSAKLVPVVNNLSPLRTTDNKLVLLNSNGTVQSIQDMGSYNIQSREIMRVRIPPNAVQTAKRPDGTLVVDLYVSTPNGISNRLQIPVAPAPKATPAPAPQFPYSAPVGYVVTNPTLRVLVNGKLDTGGSLVYDSQRKLPSDVSLTIFPVGVAPQGPLTVQLTFPFSATTVLEPIVLQKVTPDPKTGAITLNSTDLDDLLKKLVDSVKASGLAITPNAVIVSSSIVVQPPADPSGVTHSYTTSNQLPVMFSFVIQPGKPAAGSQAPAKPATAGTAAPAASATAMAASGLWPKGYSRGIVPAREAGTESQDGQNSSFRFTSSRVDRAARRTAADADEDEPFPNFFAQDQGGGSVIRTQAGGSPLTVTPPSLPSLTLPPGTTMTIPGTNQTLTIPNPTQVTIPSGAPAQLAHSLLVMPRTPPVNVSVPVTNNATPPRQSCGLFHRRNATPQNPTRPPLLERLMGNP
jgi:hypothetical protein